MKSYKAFAHVMGTYWSLYGGWPALLTSIYFHAAILVAAACYPLWWADGRWASLCLGAVPNLLGFSIGAFAIILSFGGRFVTVLQNPVEAKSDYLAVVSSFVHFIVVQTLALLLALVGAAWPNRILGFLGCVVFSYALVLALAAAMRLFRLARIHNVLPDGKATEE